MATEKKSREFVPKKIVKGSILAHAEHIRTIGEAFVKAGETYKVKHSASDKEDSWLKDLPRNILEASKDLHGSIFESPKRVYDIYRQTIEGDKT